MKTDAEESAYRWVGSSPCEDCDGFIVCNEKMEFSCRRRKDWDKDYKIMVKEFKKLYEGKNQEIK